MFLRENPYDNPLVKVNWEIYQDILLKLIWIKFVMVIFEGFEDDNTYEIAIIDYGNNGMIYDLKSIKGYDNGWQSISK